MSETGLLPAYLIVGTDGVKRDHAVSRMKARLEKSGMVEFNLDERDMTKDPDIESIIGSLNTFPMGSEFRLVILDGCSKLAKAVSARDMRRSLELFNLLPAKSYVWTYTLLCGRIRELIVAKALDARGQGRELAATLKLQSWQVKNHLTWARRFSMAELVAALEGAVDVELALKGSADSQTALLLWITNILRKS